MSQNAMKRLYLMQVGSMPEYQIPIVCYLVQTGDGKNILIDSGLPEVMPEGESEFENGQDVLEQLARDDHLVKGPEGNLKYQLAVKALSNKRRRYVCIKGLVQSNFKPKDSPKFKFGAKGKVD